MKRIVFILFNAAVYDYDICTESKTSFIALYA